MLNTWWRIFDVKCIAEFDQIDQLEADIMQLLTNLFLLAHRFSLTSGLRVIDNGLHLYRAEALAKQMLSKDFHKVFSIRCQSTMFWVRTISALSLTILEVCFPINHLPPPRNQVTYQKRFKICDPARMIFLFKYVSMVLRIWDTARLLQKRYKVFHKF